MYLYIIQYTYNLYKRSGLSSNTKEKQVPNVTNIHQQEKNNEKKINIFTVFGLG